MPAVPSPLPEEVKEAFRRGVDEFLAEDDAKRDPLARATLTGVRTYALGLEELARKPERYEVHPTGWRVNATAADGTFVLAAEIAERNGTLRLVSVLSDGNGQELAQRLQQIERTLPAQENFTITLLRIPGILTEAFVARPDDSRQPSHIVPIRTPGNIFTPMERTNVTNFFDRLTSAQAADGRLVIDRFRDFNEVQMPGAAPESSDTP